VRLDVNRVVPNEALRAHSRQRRVPLPLVQVRQVVGNDRDPPRLALVLGLLALGRERDFETGNVDSVAPFAGHQLGEIDRKAEGIVEAERVFAGDRAADSRAALCAGDRRELVEARHAAVDRRQKALFFGTRRVEDVLLADVQFRKHVPHLLDDLFDDEHERRFAPSEQPGMAHRAAENTPQDIAAAVIAWEDSVRQQKGNRAGVVRDDAKARRSFLLINVLDPDDPLDRRDVRREEVGVIVVRDSLQHGRDALEARARVDAWLWKRQHLAVCLPVELHEDEIPDLEEAAGLGALDERVGGKFRTGDVGPLAPRARGKRKIFREVREIDINFGARAAGARVCHLPEIIGGAESVDP
jgi:hypothetical protein